MKIKPLLLLVLLILGTQLCAAQNDSAPVKKEFRLRHPLGTKPLIVLKSGKRVLELDPQKDEFFKFDTVAVKSIKSITVLKDEDAKGRYGSRGANGVLVVQLDENYVFSKAVMMEVKIEE